MNSGGKYGVKNLSNLAESGIPVETDMRIIKQTEKNTQFNHQNVLRQDVPALKHYYSQDWGISFSTPPTWFYSVNEHVPVVLSSLWPGLIFTRVHRPQSGMVKIYYN
jgi:hypothetical protein